MHKIRLDVTDPRLAASTVGGLPLGKAFVFVTPGAFEAPALAWVPRLLGAVRPAVVPLVGGEPLALPGVTLRPASAPAVELRSLTCDRSLYREGRDVVRLLALDLLAPGAERVIEVDHGGREFGRYPVTLDARGAALLELRDLPAGDFAARVQRATGADTAFTVAVYRLAPLVASLLDRQHDASRSQLRLRLRVEAHGVPVDGAVTVDVLEAGQRRARERAEARAGLVEVTVPLGGQGPHELAVQLVDDPSRTASVPLVGSRQSEREQTLWSTLGPLVHGALLPSGGSREVRGVHLTTGDAGPSPLRLLDVAGGQARVEAAVDVEAACLVVLDPTFPVRRGDAIDPATAPHPGHADAAYQRGERLFQQGKYLEARVLFELALTTQPVAHPNYAYYAACCQARLGDRRAAVAALRTAIEHGWRDLDYLASDDDLASLRGDPAFEALLTGGRRVVSVAGLARGQQVAVEGLGPLSLLAAGALVGGQPWEGWAALLAPSEVTARVIAPELPTPGSEVRVDVEVGQAHPQASVFVVVRDARMLPPDTPLNRLAGRLKQCVHEAGQRLGDGAVSSSIAAQMPAAAPPHPPPFQPRYAEGMSPSPAMPLPGAIAAPMMRSMVAPSSAPPLPGRPLPPAAMPSPQAPPAALGGRPAPAAGAPAGPGSPPALASYGAPPPRPGPGAPAGGSTAGDEPAAAAPGARAEGTAADGAPRPVTEEPEIVFAGLIEARDGQATAVVTLGPTPAEYVVEAFVLAGLSWARTEHRFRADRVPSVALEVATFVQAGDTAVGRAVARCASGQMRLRVLRDGAPVGLLYQGRALAPDEVLAATEATASFLVQAGDHEAVVEDVGTGEAGWTGRRVDEPGRLRRLARAVRALSPGERVSLGDDPSVRALRVLPGLDAPFTALLDATSDYGHACCEQTAAKIVAASAMLLLARDPARRARAEAIVLAGVRREQTMWLPGRGFRMYPDSPPEPNAHWSPRTALYLWWLAPVREALQGSNKTLLSALEDGLRMAADATQAHRLAWPPAAASDPESAYLVARFGASAAAREQALALARARAAGSPGGGAVQARIDRSYLAATLLRLGGPSDLAAALRLANGVTRDLGPDGRLYSTADSVAAIALMAELRAARVGDGGGPVEVNGVRLSSAEATSFAGEVRAVAAAASPVVIEELRVVDERWDALPSTVPVQVTLERQGRAARRIGAGDEVVLRARLTAGYQAGDLLWVSLPDALSRVQGGGQVKHFSVDFAGQSEVAVPLAATGLTVGPDGQPAPQHFAACVRNMFEQERVGLPGPLDITVEGASGGSALSRLVRGVKGLFGS